jgi:hypothetical protein
MANDIVCLFRGLKIWGAHVDGSGQFPASFANPAAYVSRECLRRFATELEAETSGRVSSRREIPDRKGIQANSARVSLGHKSVQPGARSRSHR